MHFFSSVILGLVLLLPLLTSARLILPQARLLDDVTPSVIVEETTITPKPPMKQNTSICYELVGCYDNNPPFDFAALELPQSPSFIDTHFLLFTRDNPAHPELLDYAGDDSTILKAKFDPSLWLRIIVHGFTNNRDSVWIAPLLQGLLALNDNEVSNVLVVDWGNGAKMPFYPNAAANTRLVGKQLSLLLQKLHDLRDVKFDKVHCIGHSLGAHTCAYASNGINGSMARISGMDPAGPFFESKDESVRLDKSDAGFVDVIHTASNLALGQGLGTPQSSGHLDFYANGGEQQPGCPSVGNMIFGLLGGSGAAAFEQASCSHGRAYGYYTETLISNCPYTGFSCRDYATFLDGKCGAHSKASYAQLGFYSHLSIGRGDMYLVTSPSSPFCGYQYVIELKLSSNMTKTTGNVFVTIHSHHQELVNVSVSTRNNPPISAGHSFLHVVSYRDDPLNKPDYAKIYFAKKPFVSTWLGDSKDDGTEIVVKSLSFRSLEDPHIVFSVCNLDITIKSHEDHEPLLLQRLDCTV